MTKNILEKDWQKYFGLFLGKWQNLHHLLHLPLRPVRVLPKHHLEINVPTPKSHLQPQSLHFKWAEKFVIRFTFSILFPECQMCQRFWFDFAFYLTWFLFQSNFMLRFTHPLSPHNDKCVTADETFMAPHIAIATSCLHQELPLWNQQTNCGGGFSVDNKNWWI